MPNSTEANPVRGHVSAYNSAGVVDGLLHFYVLKRGPSTPAMFTLDNRNLVELAMSLTHEQVHAAVSKQVADSTQPNTLIEFAIAPDGTDFVAVELSKIINAGISLDRTSAAEKPTEHSRLPCQQA